MREKHDHKNSSPDNEQRRDEPDFEPSLLSLAKSLEPAPIDIVGFGKRPAEIIAKAVRASRAVQIPKVVRLRRPVPFGTHDKDLPPTFRHLVSIAIRATSLEVVRHPTAASSPACLCVRPRSFRARMLLGCRPKVRFALVFATAAPLRWRAAVAPIDAGSPISRFPSDQNCNSQAGDGVVTFVQTSSGISLASITLGPSPNAQPGGPRRQCPAAGWAAWAEWTINSVANRNDEGPAHPGPFFCVPSRIKCIPLRASMRLGCEQF